MAESAYLRMLLGRLDLLRPRAWFWRANTGVARRIGGAPVRFGEPGQPDVLGTAAGRAVGIESKDEGKKQSAEQRAWQADWELAGGIYILAVGKEGTLAAVSRVAQLLEAPW